MTTTLWLRGVQAIHDSILLLFLLLLARSAGNNLPNVTKGIIKR